MAEKVIDLDRLQRLTERGRQKANKREQKEQLSEDQKNDTEAEKLANEIFGNLPEKIDKKAQGGHDSLTIYLPSGYQIHDKVKRLVSSWCWANNLSVRDETIHPSDDCTEDVLVISWAKKK